MTVEEALRIVSKTRKGHAVLTAELLEANMVLLEDRVSDLEKLTEDLKDVIASLK